MMGLGGSKQPLKRTAKDETLPLNRSQRQTLLNVVLAFTRVKDRFLGMLGRTTAWHHLDDLRTFRTATKGERLDGVPAHLQDQALLDAVDTMRRHVQSAVVGTHVKAKVFTRFDGAQRHHAFWILHRYAPIGAAMRGEAPNPAQSSSGKGKGMTLSVTERKEVVRFLRRTLRQALGTRLLVYTSAAALLWTAPCTAFPRRTAGNTCR